MHVGDRPPTVKVALNMKRVFDVCVGAVLLIILSPVLALIALVIRVKMGPPILFRQERSGFHGEPFSLYKFRTMTDARDAQGSLLPDTERLTPVGRFLRATSLDEMPELINVLKGDMSLVGPRPLIPRYMPYYSQRETKRFNMYPGMSGWAQISGRNRLSWNARLAFDAWYVENWSLVLDLRILSLTVWKVIRREGMVTDPRSTMLDLDQERSGCGP